MRTAVHFGEIGLKSCLPTTEGHEVVAVTGKSGSGKSSLLYCLAGIARPDRGPVFYAGRNIGLLNDDQLSELRRKEFGFVFQ